MRIEQVDLADTEKIRACHEVNLAADRIDTPEGPWLGDRAFRDWMTLGWGGDPREVWVAPAQGPVAGWYRLELPDRENLDRAHLNLVVHPSARRHGIGRALLRHAAARTAAHGPRRVTGIPGRPISPWHGAGHQPGDMARACGPGTSGCGCPGARRTGPPRSTGQALAGFLY
jgi:GNAT superfamily N-acetyltransferase